MARPSFTGAGTIFSVIVGITATVLGLIAWNLADGGSLGVMIRVVAVALFAVAVIAAASLVAVRSTALVERLTGWKNPTLEFSHWPVELGSRVGVTYRRRPLKAQALADTIGAIEIEAEIVCEEWVQYTVGTDTRTESHEVVEIELEEPARLVDGCVEATFWFTVPTDVGGPTIDFRNNKIRWHIENELDGPLGRQTETRVAFTVAPALDRDAVIGEGPAIEGSER